MRLSSTYICLFGVLHLCLIGCQPKVEETDTDTSTETDTDSDTDAGTGTALDLRSDEGGN